MPAGKRQARAERETKAQVDRVIFIGSRILSKLPTRDERDAAARAGRSEPVEPIS